MGRGGASLVIDFKVLVELGCVDFVELIEVYWVDLVLYLKVVHHLRLYWLGYLVDVIKSMRVGRVVVL